MADNGVSGARLEWMRHGILLCRERLEQPYGLDRDEYEARERLGHPVGLDAVEVAGLRREIELREAALRGIETGELTGAVLVMGRYMVRMADLHIAWYGREIGDGEFYAGARAARAAMIEGLREVQRAG